MSSSTKPTPPSAAAKTPSSRGMALEARMMRDPMAVTRMETMARLTVSSMSE